MSLTITFDSASKPGNATGMAFDRSRHFAWAATRGYGDMKVRVMLSRRRPHATRSYTWADVPPGQSSDVRIAICDALFKHAEFCTPRPWPGHPETRPEGRLNKEGIADIDTDPGALREWSIENAKFRERAAAQAWASRLERFGSETFLALEALLRLPALIESTDPIVVHARDLYKTIVSSTENAS